jgi:serine/threonine protein kinase
MLPGPITACPEDATFARLVEGRLPAGELRALEAHCDGCSACSRTLAELARTVTPEVEPGETIGNRYVLREPIGTGGMGVVFAAFDTQLRRKVAVKRLRDTGGGAAAERRRARFLREAQLLASLSHLNVLTVHDLGGIDGELYVVTELVDGLPMSRWIAEAAPRLRWGELVDLFVQAGRGLAAAHRIGVVHRDVKPENILVARSGRVLIGDFGLAGLMDAGERAPEGAPGAPSLTQTGSVLGTPAYMAPEQHDGKPGDARSDQFSFCVSLYESLHGRRPFPGHTASEIAAAMRARRPVRGGDGVPGSVDRVLATGLAIDPSARHPSMDDLLAALAEARARPLRRPMLAVGLTALVLGGATAALFARHAPPRGAPLAARAPALSVSSAAASTSAAPLPVDPSGPPREAAPSAAPAATPRPASRRAGRLADPAAVARAQRWARQHPEADPHLLLDLADRAHDDRDGAGCLLALKQIPADAWPGALAERAQRRRGSCEMLRGHCDRGRRLLEPLDGADATRALLLADCPVAALASVDDRLAAVSAQADETRYAGNLPARRRDLKLALLRQTESPELAPCLHDASAGRACRRRLSALARAYQVVTESFLAAGACREGAELDVMQSQVRFQSLQPDAGDPALRCRAERIFRAYPACAAAGEAAERRCLSH